MLHTHSFTYHPRYIMFLSQYFSFPLSVSFHQCSTPIHSSTCCSYRKDKRRLGTFKSARSEIGEHCTAKYLQMWSQRVQNTNGNIHTFCFPCSNMTANSVATPAVNRRNGTRMQHHNATRTPPADAGKFRCKTHTHTHTHTHRLARLLHTTATTPATNTTEAPS